MSWHKCFLCGCEYRDDSSESRFGYCPGCRESMERQKQQERQERDDQSQDARKQDRNHHLI